MSGEVKNNSSLPVDAQMPGSSGKSIALPLSKNPTFYASKADETLVRLAKLIKTTAGLGSLLSVSSYSLYIIAYLHMKSPSRTQVLAKISHILGRPVPKLPAKIATPAGTSGVSPLAPLIGIINDTRFSIRLTGLIPLYVLLRTHLKNKNPKDKILHNLAVVQAISYIAFQVLENLWLLSGKAILSPQWVEKRGGALSFMRWSCRAWLFALTCDFARLAREAIIAKEQGTEKTMSKEEKAVAEQKWWSELFTSTSWYPMAIHYSLANGIGMNQGLVGLSGMLAGFGGLSRAWAATRD